MARKVHCRPNRVFFGGDTPWEYGDLPYDCVEAWQAPWPFRNEESLAFWDALLLAGRRVIAVGGSDYHQPLLPMQGRPHLLGQPITWVYANALSVEGVLAGLRSGRVCISADVDGARLDLRVFDGTDWREMGDTATPSSGEISVTCQVTGGTHSTQPGDWGLDDAGPRQSGVYWLRTQVGSTWFLGASFRVIRSLRVVRDSDGHAASASSAKSC